MVRESKQSEVQLIREKTELENQARAEIQRIEQQRQTDIANGERTKAEQMERMKMTKKAPSDEWLRNKTLAFETDSDVETNLSLFFMVITCVTGANFNE